jgi:formylglycine-generating enzyme required for sulfatase activity
MKPEKMIKRRLTEVALASGLLLGLANGAAGSSGAPLRRCAPDAVTAGTVCLDRYEESVWRVPEATTTNATLVHRIQLGRASRADLEAGGATQLGVDSNYLPCTTTGQNCTNDIYAVSLPAEIPSRRISWFQAQEACANSAKRLPTNAEWQVGANGTPDPGPDNGTTDCNSDSNELTPTGSRSACVSGRGAFDMVGNLAEWVADWVPVATNCTTWGGVSDDAMCFSGASEVATGPSALVRGGGSGPTFFGGAAAGPLSISASFLPSGSASFIGFRCAR